MHLLFFSPSAGKSTRVMMLMVLTTHLDCNIFDVYVIALLFYHPPQRLCSPVYHVLRYAFLAPESFDWLMVVNARQAQSLDLVVFTM